MMGLFKLFVFLFMALLPVAAAHGQTRDVDLSLLRDDMDRDSLRAAVQRSLEFLAHLPPDRIIGERPRKTTAQELRESLVSFLSLADLWEQPEKLAEEIRSRFDFYPIAGDAAEAGVLVTGYYQPVIEGSVIETPDYRFPLYRKPDDLVEVELAGDSGQLQGEKRVGRLDDGRLVPYHSRLEIEVLGRLKGKGYEIAWVKDPVDLFFLHIQGSGLIRLADGRRLRLNYAASNGRPYKSIGRLLMDSGKIPEEEMSMQRLRRFLAEHPEERDALLAQNERYIFFRLVNDGPLGSLEVPLTSGRSIAADPLFFPRGALGLMVARKPILDAGGNLTGWQPFSRLVLSQDAGSAIRGPKRVDLYFGSGDKAGQEAGFMKSAGAVYLLMPRRREAR